jgi:hypothetical protein
MIFPMPIKMGKDEATLNCEMQIRSRLQHTWAHLSREDLYASEDGVPRAASREIVDWPNYWRDQIELLTRCEIGSLGRDGVENHRRAEDFGCFSGVPVSLKVRPVSA